VPHPRSGHLRVSAPPREPKNRRGSRRGAEAQRVLARTQRAAPSPRAQPAIGRHPTRIAAANATPPRLSASARTKFHAKPRSRKGVKARNARRRAKPSASPRLRVSAPPREPKNRRGSRRGAEAQRVLARTQRAAPSSRAQPAIDRHPTRIAAANATLPRLSASARTIFHAKPRSRKGVKARNARRGAKPFTGSRLRVNQKEKWGASVARCSPYRRCPLLLPGAARTALKP